MTDPSHTYDQAPLPSRHPTAPAALRRPHAAQPPNLLITSLDNARQSHLGIGPTGQTPISTTSLSSPFSLQTQSAHPQSFGGNMITATPQTFRPQQTFSTAYNPQEWGPVNTPGTPTASGSRRQARIQTYAPQPVGPDEPVTSPPPPYSPRRGPETQVSPRNHSNVTSPLDTTSPDTDSSNRGTPNSATGALSPDFQSTSARVRGISTLGQHSASASPNVSSAPTFPPPPPSTNTRPRSRANSKVQSSGLLSSLRIKTSAPSPAPQALNLRPQDTTRLAQRSDRYENMSPVQPPGARRAASTGAIGLPQSATRSPSNMESPTVWENGLQIPPPPPGPPPAASRAQSLNRYAESPSSTPAPRFSVRHRPPPGTGTALEAVPPTPANWSEEPPSATRKPMGTRAPVPLHIDTRDIAGNRRSRLEEPMTVVGTTPSHVRRDSSTGGLFRSPAVRNRSAMGIRERRNESRHGKGRAVEDPSFESPSAVVSSDEEDALVRPANLVLAAKTMGQRKGSSKTSQRSGMNLQNIGAVMDSNEGQLSSTSQSSFHKSPSTAPTQTHLLPREPSGRPISHLLHMPVSDEGIQVALTPSSKALGRPISDLLGPESPNTFAMRANERHRNFASMEAAAASDSERLDLFVQYILAESRIRREQYAAIFERQEIKIREVIRTLFEVPAEQRESGESGEVSPKPSLETASRRTSISSSALGDSSSQDETSSNSRKYESPSSATTNSSINRPGSGYVNDYVPCLSPIASMSIATGQDEVESRGRAPSRWWEGSNSGDTGPSEGFKVLARSKRESKYMGLSKEAFDSPSLFDQGTSTPKNNVQSSAGRMDTQHSYGGHEYPAEKVGWHQEENHSYNMPPPPPLPVPTPLSTPYTPNAHRLDVSRLITLPPPFPRHHPAVNNSHPDLADVRAVIRSLQEKSELDRAHETYHSQIQNKRQRALSWQEHQRSLHQQDVQFMIAQGDLSSSDYGDLEERLQERIFGSEKEVVQAEFDLFQDMFVSPLHAVYTDRVKIATANLDQLSSRVFSDAQSHSPNLPQEEGDERPELLELLTTLKWLFDAREGCHRQLFDLLTERNNKYRSVVVLPYTQQNLQAKVRDASTFFLQDAADRKKSFDSAVSNRANAFLRVIESNVSRGAEMQLDAFWSIAPQLKELLQKVPVVELPGTFEVHIPTEEYEENPSYQNHPLQYLYSLLSHAEKSTYQFIESQVNLFCLLHEIRNAALLARLRSECIEKEADEAKDGDRRQKTGWDEWQKREQAREESHMTADLKEKVGVVEGQWKEALGEELRAVRERVRGWLLEEDGWDDDQAEL